jgi:hypothetical protein
MDEGGRNQDTGAEMSRDEEELVRDRDPWKPFDHYRETARCSGQPCSQLVLKGPRITGARSQTSTTRSEQQTYPQCSV